MNNCLSLVAAAMLCLCSINASSQTPNLPVKGTLSQTLLQSKTFSDPAQADTVTKQQPIPNSYSLELIAKVNAATGRGLDIEARDAAMKGWRLTLDAANLKASSSLAAVRPMTISNSGEAYKIRVAVRDDSAYIYQNGAYIESQPLSAIKDIVNGNEVTNPPNSGSPSLISNWAGTAPNNTGRPTDYGWGYTGTTTNIFNTANATSGSRYTDVNATVNTHTLDGNTYIGRLLFMRWDNSSIQNMVYNYPVTLEANTVYDFSMLHAYFSNSTGGRSITVGIGKTTSTTDRIASHTFFTTGTRTLKREDFVFTSQEAGTYYLTFTGDWALFTIGELALRKYEVTPRFVFGKNYPAGAVDMEISSVTYEEGAYAPAAIETGAVRNISVSGATASYLTSFNTNYIVAGKTDIHLTGEFTPLVNSTVELNADGAWLFIDNVKPSKVITGWLDKVRINGVPASADPDVRVAIYRNGTVIIPNGKITAAQALKTYTGPGLTGDMKSFEIQTYHDSLGVFDNKIRSFTLHRGFMATLANNPDGSGYSRVFIANDSDLVVNQMPAGLDTTVSFIRVFKWDWPSKKGWAGGGGPVSLTNSTWFYDWNIAGTPTADYEYALIRHNAGWPGWNDINAKTNANTLLGFNEPDQADQANMTVEEAIRQWPEMMKSGLRIGSPAPANPQNNWITNFLSKCDSLNYRVDFVAVHCYWNSRTPQQWYSGLKAIYDRVKRPLWITEWNNGANWTGEAWPSDPAAQFEKQYNDIKGILQVLDTTSFIERYSIYNWVENKRAMVLADTLTKAGKYYAADKSGFAYNPAQAFIHNWKLAAPFISASINNDDYFKVTLKWKDLNGEMGSGYVLERKIDGRDTNFLAIKTDSVYVAGSELAYTDSVYAKATYRVKAFSRDGSQFVYSSMYDVVRDAVALPPASLTGEVLSSDQVRLNWNAGTNARSYNLKRSLSADGPFETILGRTNLFTYTDSLLTPATTYYYVVTALNSAGESINSTELQLTTKELVAPAGVVNPHIASGDSRVTLSWDFIYDARYEIQRASTAGGVFTVIADNVRSIRYVDSACINDQAYYYKIVPYNAAGRGPETAVLTGTPVFGQHLHLAFNENTGKFAEDVWGAYHGTWVDTVAWIAGKDSASGAIGLNRTARSFVQLPEAVVSELNDFTIATWFRMPANQVNNTRLFDFGNDGATFMVFVPRNGTSVRYKISSPTGIYDRFITYTFPLEQWVHMAISQKGQVFKFYANGQLIYTDSSANIRPSDMGITRNNYLGKSQFPNDPYSDHMYDDFRIYNYDLSQEQINRLVNSMELKKYQLITFGPLADKRIGDTDFTVTGSASSGLPLSYSSSDTSIAKVDQYGLVQLNAAGEVRITATQEGNDQYNEASASQLFSVLPFHLRAEHLNANGSNLTGTSLRPYLKIINQDTVALKYSELTARYWLAAENFTGINTWIDYAALGNKVKAKYVPLASPRNNAFGFIEYSFDSAAGDLTAGNNSGVIQSRTSNSKWGILNEENDYSHTTAGAYTSNEKISLYRNGKLVWGAEPVGVAEQLQLYASSQSSQSGTNTISSTIQVANSGNIPLNYEDISIRYWFTAEGSSPLNYWIDFADLGSSNIQGRFVKLDQPAVNADTYLEFTFKPAAGVSYPLSDCGKIKFRVSKSDWSAFNQANDHSYEAPAAMAQNPRITVYYKGELAAGTEPVGGLTARSNQAGSSKTEEILPQVKVYPNPFTNDLNLQVGVAGKGANVKVYNTAGVLVWASVITGANQVLPLKHLPAGVYQLVVWNGKETAAIKLLKQ